MDIKTENTKILKLMQSKVQESKCDSQNYSNIFLPKSTKPLNNELEKKIITKGLLQNNKSNMFHPSPPTPLFH